MADNAEGWRLLFNRVYAGAEYSNVPPSAFMTRVTEQLQPGNALDVCTGQGRNAIYLAAAGWQVTGFDVADRGLALAYFTAGHHRKRVSFVLSAERAFPYGSGLWDLIVMVYAPVAVTDVRFVSKLQRALKPRGAVVIESFAYDSRIGRTRLGTLEIDPAKLRKAFAQFSVLAYEDTDTVSEWSNGPARVVRLFARTGI
jgi:SAM-dependent methyltransferase